MTRLGWLVPVAFAATVLPGGAAASAQDTLPEIRQRFEQRYREIFKLKVEGKLGETFTGHVELVAAAYGDDEIRALVEAENRDRRKFYELQAEDLRARTDDEAKRARITPELIARRNAARNLEKAGPSEHYRMADGVWIQKKDEKPYERVLRLKGDGVIGESADGYLAVRRAGEADRALLEREKERRLLFYRRIATLRADPVEEVAREHGAAHLKYARPGDWYLTADGTWSQARPR